MASASALFAILAANLHNHMIGCGFAHSPRICGLFSVLLGGEALLYLDADFGRHMLEVLRALRHAVDPRLEAVSEAEPRLQRAHGSNVQQSNVMGFVVVNLERILGRWL